MLQVSKGSSGLALLFGVLQRHRVFEQTLFEELVCGRGDKRTEKGKRKAQR